MKIALLGAAGGIGQALAFLLKIQLPAHCILSLYDIAPVTPGVAVDLSHIPTPVSVIGYSGPNPAEALHGADLVLIAAGIPRHPGMERRDLFETNAKIIQSLLQPIAQIAPHACIGLITNPLNSLVPLAAEILKQAQVYNWRKLFGITTLDLTRAITFLTELKGGDPGTLDLSIIGGHSGRTILPLFSQLRQLTLSDSEINDLTQRIQNAGTDVVRAKAGHGSATLAMAYAGTQFTLLLIRALQGEPNIQVTAYVESEPPYSRCGWVPKASSNGYRCAPQRPMNNRPWVNYCRRSKLISNWVSDTGGGVGSTANALPPFKALLGKSSRG